MNDALQRYIEAASGLTQVTAKKAERIVKNLVRSGEAASDQVGDLVDDLMERSGRNREAIMALVKAESTRVVRNMGLATSKELDRLQKQVADLKRSLGRTQRDSGAAKTSTTTDGAEAAAKTAKKTAKKTAGKTAKKTAAAVPAGKTAAKRTVKKTAAAAPAGKTAAKKTAKKTAKTAAKKTAAKKSAAKKTAKKTTAATATPSAEATNAGPAKTAAKKTAKKTAGKKTTAKKATVKKAAADVRRDAATGTDAPPEASPILAERLEQVTNEGDES
ncbi:phasin family protein [Egicoccus sp. AB-alg2]|uniref:phasin family protein n=1 Tax=Egicoccus sp. AB-alg2 TaxID=3242693 RepID=UPI00359DB145